MTENSSTNATFTTAPAVTNHLPWRRLTIAARIAVQMKTSLKA